MTVVSMWSFFHYNPNFYYYESYNLIKTNTLVFIYFQWHLKLVLDDTMDEESKKISKSESLPTGCCLAFARFLASFSLALLVKVLLIKKGVYIHIYARVCSYIQTCSSVWSASILKTSMLERFLKMFNNFSKFYSLTIFAKGSIIGLWPGSKYSSQKQRSDGFYKKWRS